MAEKRVPTSIRLPEELLTWLDAYAEQRGVSRGQLIEASVAGLRQDAERGVPDLPAPEPVPSPKEKGTDEWREPTEAEVEDTRARFAREYPDRDPLPPARFQRLCRAEAKLRDQGALPPVGAPFGRGDGLRDGPVQPDGRPSREPGARVSSFESGSRARSELFGGLRTPESAKGGKPR